jgi:hypothetical protein
VATATSSVPERATISPGTSTPARAAASATSVARARDAASYITGFESSTSRFCHSSRCVIRQRATSRCVAKTRLCLNWLSRQWAAPPTWRWANL